MSNLIDPRQIVAIARVEGQDVSLTLTKTRRGWAQRSATPGYNADYVSDETLNDILSWYVIEFEQVSFVWCAALQTRQTEQTTSATSRCPASLA